MRISDWSSDVCSSDLKSDGGEPAIQPFHLARGQFAAGVGPDVKHIVGAADDRLMDRVHAAVFRAGLTCAKGKGEGSQQRSEEHTSELQSLMRISYAVFCLKKKKTETSHNETHEK